MTVNERLSVAGVERAWDTAIKSEDREKLAEIMKQVGLEARACTIIEAAIGRWRYDKPKHLRYQEMMRQQHESSETK